MDINSYKDISKYLMNSVPVFGKKSGLENVNKLLSLLDEPHKNIEFIHVAGTNGKGSVCQMLSNILIESNLKTGLFTSPHIQSVNERIKINNKDISDDIFVEIYKKVNKSIDIMVDEGYNHPTFFEIMFTMAMLYFADNNIDVAIVEAGIGGRLDTTNVIDQSIVSIITSIGLDHVDILGDTVEKIANEKAGIIKPYGNVILNSKDEVVISNVSKKVEKENAKLYLAGEYICNILKRSGKSVDFSINNKYYNYDSVHMNILSDYQIDNVATALMTIEVLKDNQYEIKDENILKGLEDFYWPGRMELINNNILLDGAHNTLGIKQFVSYINSYCSDRNVVLVFSMLKTKDYQSVIDELTKIRINQLIITKCTDKSIDYETLSQEFLKHNITAIEETNLNNIINEYKNSNDLLCFVGSLYLISAVKKII